MFVPYVDPNNFHFLACLLVGLLPYWKYVYIGISPVLDEIFLKFFGDIPRMFLEYFQIIMNFMYICQSVSCLMSFLKLGLFRDFSSSG